jgi:hypothetical protein
MAIGSKALIVLKQATRPDLQQMSKSKSLLDSAFRWTRLFRRKLNIDLEPRNQAMNILTLLASCVPAQIGIELAQGEKRTAARATPEVLQPWPPRSPLETGSR